MDPLATKPKSTENAELLTSLQDGHEIDEMFIRCAVSTPVAPTPSSTETRPNAAADKSSSRDNNAEPPFVGPANAGLEHPLGHH